MPGPMHQILVVPHELLNANQVALLKRDALSISEASCAAEALEVAVKCKPALIVFSSELRTMSAAEFCETVRSDPGSD